MSATLRWGFAASVAGAILLLPACSEDETCSTPSVTPPTDTHTNVVLRDVFGEPLDADSDQPYSPRMTCGRCHDIDTITHGYHFQQGRSDENGKMDARLTKPWNQQVAVLSPGMFGKW